VSERLRGSAAVRVCGRGSAREREDEGVRERSKGVREKGLRE